MKYLLQKSMNKSKKKFELLQPRGWGTLQGIPVLK